MKLILLIIVLALFLSSCGQHSNNNYNVVEQNKKEPLKRFTEEDVVKYAITVFSGMPSQNFTIRKNDDEFLLIYNENRSDSKQQYIVKIGPHGLVLNKEKGGEWTDRFKDRRILYYEQDDKLIVSELFEGDSTAYHEFVK